MSSKHAKYLNLARRLDPYSQQAVPVVKDEPDEEHVKKLLGGLQGVRIYDTESHQEYAFAQWRKHLVR